MTKTLSPALRHELHELTASMCKALNDPKRLMVLYALRDGPHSVNDLCAALSAPQSNVSQHLAVLRDRGLVEATRRGSSVIYSLRYPRVIDAIELLRGLMTQELERRRGLIAE